MKPPKPVIAVVAIAIIAALVWLLVFRSGDNEGVLIASGTVEATEAQLGFQSAGRIESIAVQEGDRVDSGAVLATLDQSEMRARRDQADAQVQAAQALLTELEGGFRSEEVAQARAAKRAAEEQFRDAERDLERTKTLYDGGAVSREVYDKAQTRYEVAESHLIQARKQLQLVEAGPRSERIAAQRAQVQQAKAALRTVEAMLRYMTITTDIPGVVTTRHREPGEVVAPGAPVLTVMNRDDRWIRVYIPENRLGALSLGQNAEISSDTYPEKTYGGEITYIASAAEFTPKTVQTAEERVKLVYEVKVRVIDDPDYELKPGLPADVRIELAES